MTLSWSHICDSQRYCDAKEIASDVWVKFQIGVLWNGSNSTQINQNNMVQIKSQPWTLVNFKQMNYLFISDMLNLSHPPWCKILVSGWTVSSLFTTFSRNQRLLVSSIFIGCISLMASSAILPCSNLFQRLYYQDLTIVMLCLLDLHLWH